MDDAELYVSSSSGQREFSGRVLDEVWPSLDWERVPADATVLDVGCGVGATTALELLRRLPEPVAVLGVDSSAVMLDKAAAFAGPRLRFSLLDVGTTDLCSSDAWRRRPFWKIFSFFCLHWVPDQRTALANINELLVPSGDLVLIIVGRCLLFKLYEEFSKTTKWGQYMQDYSQFVSPYNRERPEEHLRAFLEETGFAVKTCREEKDFAFIFPKFQEMADSLMVVIPFTSRLPPDLQAEFRDEMLQAALDNGVLTTVRSNQSPEPTEFRFNFSVLVAHAVKRGSVQPADD